MIDQNDRVGDNWRKRYHQLVLHDPVWYDHMPYVPFPATWPIFTPKDKLADFFEAYVKILDLNVWMKSTILESEYHDEKGTWEIKVERQFTDSPPQVRVFHPRHVIYATGHSGKKYLPSIKGMDDFRGNLLCHSSEFRGAREGQRGRNAVVVGSCNSAHDIAQDFYEKGYNVTMVQRSSTCVVSSRSITEIYCKGVYEEGGPPVEDADLIVQSVPMPIYKAIQVSLTSAQAVMDQELLSRLEKQGFKLDRGPNGAGLFLKYFQRGGGYYIDVGASDLIASGQIKIKQGQEITEILEKGLRFADGTELEADEVVLATGYQNMRTQTREVFGDKVADRVGDVWGYDEKYEMRAIWRKTGHPGFWFHGGNLALCRYYSRLLALQIKALEEGLCQYNDV
jgi:cation diffusion facilitator CzcD-associated flavoprotein CzcO